MRRAILGIAALAVVSLTINTVSAQPPEGRSDRPGFDFGGAPEFDRPPLPHPRYVEAITTNPALDTSFIMMESFGISMTVKKR